MWGSLLFVLAELTAIVAPHKSWLLRSLFYAQLIRAGGPEAKLKGGTDCRMAEFCKMFPDMKLPGMTTRQDRLTKSMRRAIHLSLNALCSVIDVCLHHVVMDVRTWAWPKVGLGPGWAHARLGVMNTCM